MNSNVYQRDAADENMPSDYDDQPKPGTQHTSPQVEFTRLIPRSNIIVRPKTDIPLAILLMTLFVGLGCNVIPGDLLPATPGTSFASAGKLILNDNAADITGSITGPSPAVYDLGAVSPGDRVIVTIDPAMASNLDPVIAIFDENEELLALNDDVDLANGQIGSAIDQVITKSTEHVYLAVAKFFFDTAGGAFEGTAQIVRGGQIPERPVQTLLLNFAGGQISIPSEGDITVPVFNAADIDPAYTGKTAAIKADIIAIVRERFNDTGLIIVVSDNNPVLAPGTFSTMHFGSFSATKFGVSEAVDLGNQNLDDNGIVFTEDFDKPFATQPSANGIAAAIGQVAVHESGHLLGLNHVADITDLMDTTGAASTLLAKQTFKSSVLSETIFPIGKQNGAAMLEVVIPK